LHELGEVDKFSRPLSNHKPLNNHKHSQPLMEVVEVEVVEVVEVEEVKVVDQHPPQEVQPLNKLQHPKQD